MAGSAALSDYLKLYQSWSRPFDRCIQPDFPEFLGEKSWDSGGDQIITAEESNQWFRFFIYFAGQFCYFLSSGCTEFGRRLLSFSVRRGAGLSKFGALTRNINPLTLGFMRKSPALARVTPSFMALSCALVCVAFDPITGSKTFAGTGAAQIVSTAPAVSTATATLASAVQADPVTLALVDGEMRTDWPDNGVVAFRRKGTKGAVTTNFVIGGTAVRNVDYTMQSGNSVTIPDGKKEVWLEFSPVNKTSTTGSKTISVTINSGNLLATTATSTVSTTLGSGSLSGTSVTLTLEPAGAKPGRKAAVRFLNQAAFGPDGGLANVKEVMDLGFEGWIDQQLKKPVGALQPYLVSQGTAVTSGQKAVAWWNQVMNSTPSADSLRQRVGFALSEIFVISDQFAPLGSRPVAMANYYDTLLGGAFGSYRDLLYSVGMHPCMGAYLSHLQNTKGDPVKGTYADENFAREIMQLFSIGLWQLNPDGTRTLDTAGQPIPTYDNKTVASMARVMTGFSFSGPKATSFYSAPENYLQPMRMWDAYHDLDAKVIISGPASQGISLPARKASKPDVGTAGLADYGAAIDALAQHPNTAPFFCKQLIQKLVTSNPSSQYVKRVAAKFSDNGSKSRGDLAAVIKAILLDPEARDPKIMGDVAFGKLKEPYLRTVNLARAFNASAPNKNFALTNLANIHFEQPMSAPNVFNFFKPGFVPDGPIGDAGLVAPEFQILNDVTALGIPNYHLRSLQYGFNRSTPKDAAELVMPQFSEELNLANDVPALMRRLDLLLMGGNLPNAQHQIVRETVEGIPTNIANWQNERVRMAIYLIVTSPDYAVLR